MAGHRALLFFALLGASNVLGQRGKKPESPIEKITTQSNFDQNQFAGKWFLVAVASECNYLKENNHQVEPTIIQASITKNAKTPKAEEHLAISTFRKLDGICWEIKHEYLQTKAKGRYILKARGYRGQLDAVVGETDYRSYAIVYYQRQRKITVKLYARTATVSDDITNKYEDHVSKLGIDMEFIYYFPTYGFCESADQFHILNEVSS
ncbi:complement component C8 gamma chain [Discoglossus pictus]